MHLNLYSGAQDRMLLKILHGTLWSSLAWEPQVRGDSHPETERGKDDRKLPSTFGKEAFPLPSQLLGNLGIKVTKRPVDKRKV